MAAREGSDGYAGLRVPEIRARQSPCRCRTGRRAKAQRVSTRLESLMECREFSARADEIVGARPAADSSIDAW